MNQPYLLSAFIRLEFDQHIDTIDLKITGSMVHIKTTSKRSVATFFIPRTGEASANRQADLKLPLEATR